MCQSPILASNNMTESQKNSQTQRRSIINAILLRLDIIAGLIIVLMALMLIPKRPWFVELFSNFLSLFMFPSVLILITMIFMRRWRSALLWVLPAIATMVLFGGLYLPTNRSQPLVETDATVHLRVMTFNLLGHAHLNRQSQIDLIRNSGADIIALQEVELGCIEVIDSQLADIYPYRALYPAEIAGTGIISKFPINNEEFFLLNPGYLYHTMAAIDIDGTPVTVISAHPPPPFLISDFQYKSDRSDEISKLIAKIPVGQTTLVMGDFNMTDQTSVYRMLVEAGLLDTWRETGWGLGYTWPLKLRGINLPFPIMRIDYIWHTDEFQAISARVGTGTVSDHLPVIADFIFNP
jgi:vancomycin resistance protein VanJ